MRAVWGTEIMLQRRARLPHNTPLEADAPSIAAPPGAAQRQAVATRDKRCWECLKEGEQMTLLSSSHNVRTMIGALRTLLPITVLSSLNSAAVASDCSDLLRDGVFDLKDDCKRQRVCSVAEAEQRAATQLPTIH